MGSIGIFDSGVGGLTVLKEIRHQLPNENIVYFADQKYVPYAVKSQDFLEKRSLEIAQFLISKDCSTLVVACNTATVSAINYVRHHLPDVPIIGVEPAIKPAALHTKDQPMLVLATKYTLQSQKLFHLIKEYAPSIQVIKQDMPQWVDLAEAGDVKSQSTKTQIITSLKPLTKHNPKAIVLACTHYPIFTSIIQEVFPNAKIFDPSLPVAQRTKELHHSSPTKTAQVTIFTTGSESTIKKTIANLLNFPVKLQSIHL